MLMKETAKHDIFYSNNFLSLNAFFLQKNKTYIVNWELDFKSDDLRVIYNHP